VAEIDTEKARFPNEPCAVCNLPGTDKKWAGQYWHKKCLRKARGAAKGML
jgi:hypothetical protein